MNSAKLAKLIIAAVVFSGAAIFVYHQATKKKEKPLFTTSKLKKRTISQVINATGTLKAKGTLNIGSLVSGIVEELHVKENQQVKKGQLLAKIDDGRANTGVKQAEGLVVQTRADFDYKKAFYKRQKKLYKAGHISQDEFEQARQARDVAAGSLSYQCATLEYAQMQFNNKKITSPISGVVIKKNISVREGVTNLAPPTILYIIAEDISKMDIDLEVDETDIGLLKLKQEASLSFDTYPHKEFSGIISEISSAPIDNSGSVAYKAVIKIDNEKLLLKPGMTVHARIVVVETPDALSVAGYLFSINQKFLAVAAQEKKYGFKPMTLEDKEAFKKNMQNPGRPIKSLWVFENNAFVEKPVEIGVTDNAFFEIVSGITESDDVVIDIQEPDAMKKFYQRLFGGGLSGKKSS